MAFLNGEELSKVKKLLLTTIALTAIGVAMRARVKDPIDRILIGDSASYPEWVRAKYLN